MPATTKSTEPQEPQADPRLDDLIARVDRLEQRVEGVMASKVAEISQEDKDKRTLARRPNTYQEAVEFEAAQKRQDARDKTAGSEG